MLENLTHMVALVQIVAGLGLVTILLAVLKQYGDRIRWRRFKLLVKEWVEGLWETEEIHPDELAANEWKVRCEQFLMKARFSPLESQQLLDMAVVVARGIVSEKFFF